MTPDQFLSFAEPLPEPMLLLSGDGLIIAGNRAVEERTGIPIGALATRNLVDVVASPASEVTHYLRLCCRSRSLVLGALTLTAGDNRQVACRSEGALLSPKTEAAPAIVLLRLVPKASAAAQFVTLNQRIDELAKEMQRRRRAEEEARQHSERLRVTLQSIGDGVIATDDQGKVALINQVAEKLTGWKRDTALGQPLETVFHIVNEGSRRTVENPALRALREGIIVGLANHTVLISADGTERPIDDSAAPIRDDQGEVLGSVLVFRDVSEQRRAAQRSLAILESITDAFCAFDREWRFTYLNRQAERLLGCSRDELLGKSHWDVYPDTLGTDLERQYRRALAENIAISFENYYPPHERWYEIHAYPSPEGLSVYFRDVSDRRRAEAVLRESEEKLRLLDAVSNLWMAS